MEDRQIQEAAEETPQQAQAPEQLPLQDEADAVRSDGEAFVPTDYFQNGPAKKRIGRGGIVAICLGVLVLLLAGAGFFCLKTLRSDPGAFFGLERNTPAPTAAVSAVPDTPAPSSAPTEVPTPTPTLDPYTVLQQQADTSIMKNILNVAFIGVDYADERTSDPKFAYKVEQNAFHADVILVLAVNFDENRVDLISIPRDTYAKIPGVKGIYKINASLDCGGGLFAEDGAGFRKVCEAASWMLGDLPVDYYYAVTMPAVKELVNAVGGVDYDLELDFKIQGRSYQKGPQHMDGQGVLDYLRVRKNIVGAGDNNRVSRQKKMMVALFNTMKEQNLLTRIPDMLTALQSEEVQIFTNTSLSQTAALALFAYGLDSENIGMYSMGSGKNGTSGVTNIFNWNFCLTDQGNRVRIIREIYGIDVPQRAEYAPAYAHYRWNTMLAEQYLDTCAPLTRYVSELLAEDDLLPTISPEPSPEPSAEPTLEPTPESVPLTPTPEAASDTPLPEPVDPDAPEGGQSADAGAGGLRFAPFARNIRRELVEVRRYTDEQRQLFDAYLDAVERVRSERDYAESQASKYRSGKKNALLSSANALGTALEELQTLAQQVATVYGYKVSDLKWSCRYEYDRSFNEIKVNFN